VLEPVLVPDVVVPRGEPEVIVWVVVCESELVRGPWSDDAEVDVPISVELLVRLAGGNPFPNPTYSATATTAAAVTTAAPRTAPPAPDRLLADLTRVHSDVGCAPIYALAKGGAR
jgi:hypothetical protein